MSTDSEQHPNLELFFDRWLTAAFKDIQIFEQTAVNYISTVLTRFAMAEKLYQVERLPELQPKSVVDMLLEAEARSRPSEREFDPFSERELRKHVADYILFMTGIFREYVNDLGILDFYFQEGRKSYRQVYEFDKSLSQPHAGVFMKLHANFERYSGGINYMKKVYFDEKMPQGTPPIILKQIYSQ